MNVLKKLDRSSRLLILTSIVGIILALSGFYLLSQQGVHDESEGQAVAKVTIYQNDTRLKRSENIHWYPVNQATDCFTNDLIFTGKESFATVEFPSGDKITLHPNSLVSLSNNLVSLESGAIEIDLTSATPLQLESFGEKFNLKENSKIRVIQNDKGQKIIPLNEAAKAIQNDQQLKKFVQADELTIIEPAPGKLFPSIDELIVNYQWKSTVPNKDFIIEFSEAKSKTPFLSVNSKNESSAISLKGFPEGMIYWKVVASSGKVSDESSFYVTKDTEIKLNSPADKDVFPLSHAQKTDMKFFWSAPLDYDQKIQIASDSEFKNILHESRAVSGKELKVQKDGSYFWRVGYEFHPNLIKWSTPFEFGIKAEVVISPIEIKLTSALFDFALSPKYVAEIEDANPCDSYQYILTKNGQILSETSSKERHYAFSKMDDGQYSLKVVGIIQNKPAVETSTNFEVKTSEPLKAPKIIKKKRKLFVKVIENIFNYIIPTSVADDTIAPLSWEGPEKTTYEVEITSDINAKPLLKKTVKTPQASFKVPKPGKYFWRVRYKEGKRWSPFSDYDEIDVIDKITLLQDPLMVSPAPDSAINLESGKHDVTFNWTTPYAEFEYFLELYAKPQAAPFKVIPVSGTSKTLKFKNQPARFWWRVVAKSKFGNSSANTIKYPFSIGDISGLNGEQHQLPSRKTPKDKAVFRAHLSQGSSSYDQKIDKSDYQEVNQDISFSGQNMFLAAEYWPGRWDHKHGLNLALDYSNFSSGQSKYKETEFITEYGRSLGRKERSLQQIFFGIHYSKINLTIDGATTSDYSVSYGSARYFFQRQLAERWSLDLNAEMLVLLQTDFVTPSFRLKPVANYRLKNNWWLNGFIGFEKNTAKPSYSEEGVSGNLTIDTQNIYYGLGLTWYLN